MFSVKPLPGLIPGSEVVGYPTCPYLEYFIKYIEERYGIQVVVGTHPIPEKYLKVHRNLPSLDTLEQQSTLLATQPVREAYD